MLGNRSLLKNYNLVQVGKNDKILPTNEYFAKIVEGMY